MSDEEKQQVIEVLAQSKFKRTRNQLMSSVDKLITVILSGEGIKVKYNVIIYFITDEPNASIVDIDGKIYSIDSEGTEKLIKLMAVYIKKISDYPY